MISGIAPRITPAIGRTPGTTVWYQLPGSVLPSLTRPATLTIPVHLLRKHPAGHRVCPRLDRGNGSLRCAGGTSRYCECLFLTHPIPLGSDTDTLQFIPAATYSFFGAQPLLVNGVTGPITVFNKVIFDIFSNRADFPPYLQFIGWVYLWGAIWHFVSAYWGGT